MYVAIFKPRQSRGQNHHLPTRDVAHLCAPLTCSVLVAAPTSPATISSARILLAFSLHAWTFSTSHCQLLQLDAKNSESPLRGQVELLDIFAGFPTNSINGGRGEIALLRFAPPPIDAVVLASRIITYFDKTMPFRFINLISLSTGPCNLFKCSWTTACLFPSGNPHFLMILSACSASSNLFFLRR